jgi:hypothetical protein
MQSKAPTVKAYLAELPAERRRELLAVRSVVKRHLPRGYAETMHYGMISYVVPLALYPAGYLGKKDVALPYVSLSAQKGYSALYLMSMYGHAALDRWFRDAYRASGKKLDMGKSCVRFRTADELALDVIGEAVAKTSVADFVAYYEAMRGSGAKAKPKAAKRAKKVAPPTKKAAPRAKKGPAARRSGRAAR